LLLFVHYLVLDILCLLKQIVLVFKYLTTAMKDSIDFPFKYYLQQGKTHNYLIYLQLVFSLI
jgi:hypothetical protein